MKYSLVIFDWDGTLFDSTDRIVDSLQTAAVVAGLPRADDAAVQNIIGLALPEAITTVWPMVSEEQMPIASQAYVEHFAGQSDVPMYFFPGALEMLAVLANQGRKLAVATGKTRRGLNELLDRFNVHHHFDATRCADETRSKPDPLMLQELLEQLSIPVEQALMVGDTTYDLMMANAIGMDSLALGHGAHHPNELLNCGPKALCHSIEELLNWITKHG